MNDSPTNDHKISPRYANQFLQFVGNHRGSSLGVARGRGFAVRRLFPRASRRSPGHRWFWPCPRVKASRSASVTLPHRGRTRAVRRGAREAGGRGRDRVGRSWRETPGKAGSDALVTSSPIGKHVGKILGRDGLASNQLAMASTSQRHPKTPFAGVAKKWLLL